MEINHFCSQTAWISPCILTTPLFAIIGSLMHVLH